MAGMYLYYFTAAALIVAIAAAGWTAWYWRKRMEAQQEADKARLRAETLRTDVKSKSAMRELVNNIDMLSSVLEEVQALQEGIDSLVGLITTPGITVGTDEQEAAFNMIKQKSLMLAQILTVTIELMFYENRPEIKKTDRIAVNAFCYDVFVNSLGNMKQGVETRLETSLDDDFMLDTNMDTLKRILHNLLFNSLINTREGSVVLKVAENKEKGVLMFSVRDTAPAIPARLRDKVFDMMPKGNLHLMLMTLRVRACKLMVRQLGGTLYIDTGCDDGVMIDFTVATSGKDA